MSNRPFRFRVWHRAKKEWVHGPGQEPNLLGEAILLGGFCNVPISELNDLEILQFTGLLDKNGKEVYEGDVLWDGNATVCPFDGKPMPSDDYPYSWWERAVVRYDNDLARFVLDFYSPYGGEGYSGRDQHIDEYIQRGDYVVGNIHDNPELLTQKS